MKILNELNMLTVYFNLSQMSMMKIIVYYTRPKVVWDVHDWLSQTRTRHTSRTISLVLESDTAHDKDSLDQNKTIIVINIKMHEHGW